MHTAYLVHSPALLDDLLLAARREAEARLAELKRSLRDLKLAERGNAYELRGKRVVLYFYPKDDTPGCTKEACAFNDALPRLTSVGALVLGVSPDTPASHARFRGKYGLGFALLSDPDKAVATRWGAFGEKLMYGRKVQGMIRSTFVIDAQGVVRKVFARVRVFGR